MNNQVDTEQPNGAEGTACGFVTLVGKPNVGKSTLLNALLGEKLAIISDKPQTTRNRIPGVLTNETGQIIFVDTPGIHRAKGLLNTYMVDIAYEALADTDVIALLVEAGIGREGEVGVPDVIREVLERLEGTQRPVVLVLNKIDQLEREQLLPIIDAWREAFAFAEIVPVSALKGDGVASLLNTFFRYMPQGPILYPEDAFTTLPERFIAAEMIREQLFRQLDKELPYSVAVNIEAWNDRAREGRIDIHAVIAVERDSQKGIVIGRGGALIKKVGIGARKALQRLLGTKVNLKLFVKVEKGWTNSARGMRDMGYSS